MSEAEVREMCGGKLRENAWRESEGKIGKRRGNESSRRRESEGKLRGVGEVDKEEKLRGVGKARKNKKRGGR